MIDDSRDLRLVLLIAGTLIITCVVFLVITFSLCLSQLTRVYQHVAGFTAYLQSRLLNVRANFSDVSSAGAQVQIKPLRASANIVEEI